MVKDVIVYRGCEIKIAVILDVAAVTPPRLSYPGGVIKPSDVRFLIKKRI
jgi:hypothetical protein